MNFALFVGGVLGSLLVLASRRRRWKITTPAHSRNRRIDLSAVERQHLHLFQGGMLANSAIEAARTDLQRLLEQGRIHQVETRLRAGLDYVVQVHALAAIGSADAIKILEHQLERRISSDPIEQGWYWVDIAHSLRVLQRTESLPALLHRAEQALALPLGHLFAAEVVGIHGFADCLESMETPLGRVAFRVLHRAMVGLREGSIPLQTFVEAELGELLARCLRSRSLPMDGLSTLVVLETWRLIQRIDHLRLFALDNATLAEGMHWQQACLADCERICNRFLDEAVEALPHALLTANPADQLDILNAIDQLRLDAGSVLLDLLALPDYPHRAAVVRALAWVTDVPLRNVILEQARLWLRPQTQQRNWWSRRPAQTQPLDVRLAMVQTLRQHPCLLAEQLLLQTAQHAEVSLRPTATAALGWWEPVRRNEVITYLKQIRQSDDAELRLSGRAASARLGERLALQEIRQGLTHEDPACVRLTIDLVVEEGLTWFWPELDRLADAEDVGVAYRAREALESLREDALSRGQ